MTERIPTPNEYGTRRYYLRVVGRHPKRLGAYIIQLYYGNEYGFYEYPCQDYIGYFEDWKNKWRLYPTKFYNNAYGYRDQREVHEMSMIFVNDNRFEPPVTVPPDVDISDVLDGTVRL